AASRGRALSPGHATATQRDCRARTGGNRCAAKIAGSRTESTSTIPTSELFNTSDHAGSHRLVRQEPGGCSHVFPYMIDPGGPWDGAGHCWMRDDELENDLRPARTTHFCGPAGKRLALQLSEQLAFTKRPIDDHTDAAVPRQRKDAIFDLAVENVVRNLHEIERLRTHDALDFPMPAPFRGGHPYVGEPAGGLHGKQRPQVFLPREEIVDLQQNEARYAPGSPRGFNLVRPAGTGRNPDFVGREQAWRSIEFGKTVTNHFLG